jgi:hypothetical protein
MAAASGYVLQKCSSYIALDAKFPSTKRTGRKPFPHQEDAFLQNSYMRLHQILDLFLPRVAYYRDYSLTDDLLVWMHLQKLSC